LQVSAAQSAFLKQLLLLLLHHQYVMTVKSMDSVLAEELVLMLEMVPLAKHLQMLTQMVFVVAAPKAR
jgi:hypothetical protein